MPNKKKKKRSTEHEKTKPYKVKHTKKNNSEENIKKPKVKKSKKNKFSARHPKLILMLKILIVLILLACVIGAGIIVGIFFGLFGDDFEISKDDLTIRASNSIIVDSNGAIIAELSGYEKRKIITLEDMADYLPKAYVAIEDERFYEHGRSRLKKNGGGNCR